MDRVLINGPADRRREPAPAPPGAPRELRVLDASAGRVEEHLYVLQGRCGETLVYAWDRCIRSDRRIDTIPYAPPLPALST